MNGCAKETQLAIACLIDENDFLCSSENEIEAFSPVGKCMKNAFRSRIDGD
jgi:hypothetical protein